MMNATATEDRNQAGKARPLAQCRHCRTARLSYRLLLSVLVLATLLATAPALAAAQEADAAGKDAKPALPGIDDRWVLMPFEKGRFVVRDPGTGQSHRIKLDLRKNRWAVRIDGTRLPEGLREGMREESKDRLALSDMRVAYGPQPFGSLYVYLHYESPCGYTTLRNKRPTTSIVSECTDTDWLYIAIDYIRVDKLFIIISREKDKLVLTRCPEFGGCS